MPAKKDTTGLAQDPATADVNRGVVNSTTVGKTEDQKRAEGTDAGNAEGAGEHDYSPEANAGRDGGGSYDTYAGAPTSEHPNLPAGSAAPLVLGQAPQTTVLPQRGSRNEREVFHPAIPNAKMQSPVVRGVDIDPRNDPRHPDHAQADRAHPDYGRKGEDHKGKPTQGKDFVDLKGEALAADAKDGDLSKPADPDPLTPAAVT